MKKGNILLGLIGAIIGSLPGVAIYVGLTMIRVFSSWSGFVALYCAIFMFFLNSIIKKCKREKSVKCLIVLQFEKS